jgi:CBS domain containing-hemolysin-like protein
MQPADSAEALSKVGWPLAATALLVAINAFFVIGEYALVRVRDTRLESLAQAGSRRARLARHIHARLERYLAACQLGVTLTSLAVGWLAEPAIAGLLLHGLAASGLGVVSGHPVVHAIAFAIALAVITFVHMTIGELAPKFYAIRNPESGLMLTAYPLRAFEATFRPFISFINSSTSKLLRVLGVVGADGHDAPPTIDELRLLLATSARAGHISRRARALTENIFGIMELEVRHILVPRVDVQFLSLQNTPQENLRVVLESGHSRFPLCNVGLDTVIGFVHARDVIGPLAEGKIPDFNEIARKPLYVPDTQPLSRLIAHMQRARTHCAVVLDEHGTSIGLAFLEDALEEIVGPIRDEFDEHEHDVLTMGRGAVEISGSLALPEAAEVLDLPQLAEERDADTIGGHVVAQLGRLPRPGDSLEIGPYRAVVVDVARRRIKSLRFERGAPSSDDGANGSTDSAASERVT